MSWDLSSSNSECDHLILLERYVLDVFDFKTLHYASNPTLNMRAPINSVANVQVWVKGSLVRPNDAVYGYQVIADPARIQTGYAFSKIMFLKPVRMVRPLIEVTYLTRRGFCLKCAAVGTVSNWSADPSGRFNKVVGIQKLAQQCQKYVLTSVNPFNSSLICQLRNYVGKKFGLSVTDSDIASEVTRVLQTYQNVQAAQKTVQTLQPAETLKDILAISARQDPGNPLKIYVSIQVSAYGSDKPIPINIALQASN